MPILPDAALSLRLPEMLSVKQVFSCEELQETEACIIRQLNASWIKALIKPGNKVAVAVGSRGISNLGLIVRTLGQIIKAHGAFPFIVPAMGSHGGATGEGQKVVLENIGITEAFVNMPIISSMEVVEIGKTVGDIPVFMDINAFQADVVIPVARIKPHTDFKGPIESGICKMLSIGLGKHVGCSRLHQEGFENFAELIPEVAKVCLQKANIGFGVAIIENAYDKTSNIEIVPGAAIFEEEPRLLAVAKNMMPRIMLPEIDVLIVESLGKEISGAGMDPNIVGRTTKVKLPGFQGPDINRIIVSDLTEATHGNACGIGLADFITAKAFKKIDYMSTYANVIASANPEAGKIPVVLQDEREAIIAAIKCCSRIDENRPRIVRITDTLHLEYIQVSINLLPIVRQNKNMRILG